MRRLEDRRFRKDARVERNEAIPVSTEWRQLISYQSQRKWLQNLLRKCARQQR